MKYFIALFAVLATAAAWCDLPQFDSGWFPMSTEAIETSHMDVLHGLSSRPMRVEVEYRNSEDPDSPVFVGQGSAFRGEADRLRHGGSGVVYYWDGSRVRILLQRSSDTTKQGGLVYGIGDGYGDSAGLFEGIILPFSRNILVRVTAWEAFPSTVTELYDSDWVPMDGSNPYLSMPHSLSARPTEVLVYIRPTGSTDWHLASGSASTSTRDFVRPGFLHYAFDDSEVRLWRHMSYPLVSTDDGWGGETHAPIYSDGDVRVFAILDSNPPYALLPASLRSQGTPAEVEVHLPHLLSANPQSVRAFATVTETGNPNFGFSFPAVGSQVKDEDFPGHSYGGIMYSHTATHVQAYAPAKFNNEPLGYSVHLAAFGDGTNNTHAANAHEVDVTFVMCAGPTPSPAPTPTISITPAVTVTPTTSLTPSTTNTVTPTQTPSTGASLSRTRSNTPSVSPTPTLSVTPSLSPTPTLSLTATPTISLTTTPTPTLTPSSGASLSATMSPSSGASVSPTGTPTPTPVSASSTPRPSPAPVNPNFRAVVDADVTGTLNAIRVTIEAEPELLESPVAVSCLTVTANADCSASLPELVDNVLLLIPSGTLAADTYGLTFTTTGTGSSPSSSTVFVEVRQGLRPDATTLTSVPARINQDQSVAYVGQDAANSDSEAALVFEWAVRTVGDPLDGGTPPVDVPILSSTTTPSTDLLPNVLPYGFYVVYLTITNSATLSDTASFPLEINEPPTSGSVFNSPVDGTASVTRFLFGAQDWTDSTPEDLPLRYVWSMMLASGDTVRLNEVPLSEPMLNETVLPQGENHVSLRIFDQLGAFTEVVHTVNVTIPAFVSGSDATSFVAGAADELLSSDSVSLGDAVTLALTLDSALPDPCRDVTCSDTEMCFDGECQPKNALAGPLCPGSTSMVTCSGHGSCLVRGNFAACTCDEGFTGAGCGLTQAEADEQQALQARFVAAQSSTLASADLTDNSVLMSQTAALSVIAGKTDRLDDSAVDASLNVAATLTSGGISNGGVDQNTATSLVSVIGGIGAASSSKVIGGCPDTAPSRRRLRRKKQLRRRLRRHGGRRFLQTGADGADDEDSVMEDVPDACPLADNARAVSGKVVDGVKGVATAVMGSAVVGDAPVVLDTPSLSIGISRASPDDLGSDFGGNGGTSISFPSDITGAFGSGAGAGAGAGGGAVDVRSTAWTSNPYAWADDAPTLAAPVISVEVASADSGDTIPVNDAATPLSFSMPIPAGTDPFMYQCRYWDDDLNAWQAQGLTAIGFTTDPATGEMSVTCASVHLTDFSGEEEEQLPAILFIDPFADAGAITAVFDTANLFATIVVFTVLLIFLVSWCWFIGADKKDKHQLDRLRRAQFLEFGELRSGMGMGALVENVEDNKRIEVEEEQLAGEAEHGMIFLAARHVYRAWRDNIRREHTFLAVFIPTPDDRLLVSRPQRLASLCAAILTAMALSAVMFGIAPSNVGGVLLVAVLSALLMLPVEMFFPFLFEKVNNMKSETLKRIAEVRDRILGKRKTEDKAKSAAAKIVSPASMFLNPNGGGPKLGNVTPSSGLTPSGPRGGSPHLQRSRTTSPRHVRGVSDPVESVFSNADQEAAGESKVSFESPIVMVPVGSTEDELRTRSAGSQLRGSSANARAVGGSGGSGTRGSGNGSGSGRNPDRTGMKRSLAASKRNLALAAFTGGTDTRTAQAFVDSDRQRVQSLVDSKEISPEFLKPASPPTAGSIHGSEPSSTGSSQAETGRVVTSGFVKPDDSVPRPLLALLDVVLLWGGLVAIAWALMGISSGSTLWNTNTTLIVAGFLISAFAISSFLLARRRSMIPAVALLLCSVVCEAVLCYLMLGRDLEGGSDAVIVFGGLQFLLAVVVFAGYLVVTRSQHRVRRQLIVDADEMKAVETAWAEETMTAGPTHLIFRMQAVLKLQAMYRLTRLTRAMEREREYRAWITLDGERRFMAGVVYAILTLYVLFMCFLNLLYGVKFSPSQQRGWLLGVITGLVLDFFVIEPLLILATTLYEFVSECSEDGLEAVVTSHVQVSRLATERPWKRTYVGDDAVQPGDVEDLSKIAAAVEPVDTADVAKAKATAGRAASVASSGPTTPMASPSRSPSTRGSGWSGSGSGSGATRSLASPEVFNNKTGTPLMQVGL